MELSASPFDAADAEEAEEQRHFQSKGGGKIICARLMPDEGIHYLPEYFDPLVNDDKKMPDYSKTISQEKNRLHSPAVFPFHK